MNTLKYLQTYDYLLDVDSWRLFANLEELSQVSQSRKTPGDNSEIHQRGHEKCMFVLFLWLVFHAAIQNVVRSPT